MNTWEHNTSDNANYGALCKLWLMFVFSDLVRAGSSCTSSLRSIRFRGAIASAFKYNLKAKTVLTQLPTDFGKVEKMNMVVKILILIESEHQTGLKLHDFVSRETG